MVILDVPPWPTTLGGYPRTVSELRQLCSDDGCMTRTGSYYGDAPWCRRHAAEQSVLERAVVSDDRSAR